MAGFFVKREPHGTRDQRKAVFASRPGQYRRGRRSAPQARPDSDRSILSVDISAYTLILGVYALIEPDHVERCVADARGVQLPGGPPGGAAGYPVLRPVPDAGRTARDAVFDIGETAAARAAEDQCAGRRAGHGPDHPRTD